MSTWTVEGHHVADEGRRTVCTPTTSVIADQIVREHNTFPDLVQYLMETGKPQKEGYLETRRNLLLKRLRLKG